MDFLDFTAKTALVVGGSSGIGNGIAQAFRRQGATVHVWGTRQAAGDYLGVLGSDLTGIHYACVDVADRDMIDAAGPDLAALDILVLSQGAVAYRRAEFTRDGWDRVMAVNLDSLMACAMKFKPVLKAAAGTLIVVSSTSAYHATRGNPAYAASKAGAVHLVHTLGEAWAPEGIRVNGIAPGLVDTKMTQATFDHPERLRTVLAGIPMGRVGAPEDMAGAALFLASNLAAYICGQTIIVDGGLTLSF